MKRKNKIIAYCLFLLYPFLQGCISDNGNYSYEDPNQLFPLEITGLRNDTTVLKGEKLQLSPVLEHQDESRTYTYRWFAIDYDKNSAARWEIAQTKDLDWAVSLEVGKYRLNFQVTDSLHNVYRRYEIVLNVTASVMNLGWYVLKTDGEYTDFDYISFKEDRLNDVLKGYMQLIPGRGREMCYQPNYSHLIQNEDGTVTKKTTLEVLHILTDKDMQTLDANELTLYKPFEEQFYGAPSVCNPQATVYIAYNTVRGGNFLINNGVLYYINNGPGATNVGKFSLIADEYVAYPSFIPFGNRQVLMFDQTSRSFHIVSNMANYLLPVTSAYLASGVDFPVEQISYDVYRMGYTLFGSKGQGMAVLNHVTEDKSVLLTASTTSSKITSVRDIPAESKLRQAQLLAPAYSVDFLYFSIDNKVYSYENAPDLPLADKEKEMLAYPAGERVVCMKHVYTTIEEKQMNSLVVLTTGNNQWHLYRYDLLGESTPGINATPVQQYEGTGEACSLMLRN